LAVQAAPAPHSIEHAVLPVQSTVQPPAGHLSAQVLLPWQLAVDPLPRVRLHVLPPPHVTVLFSPVSSVHSLVPLHVAVQFEVQLPTHSDWPLHVVVHPVPHVESHVFFDWQLYVTLSGSTPASAPPSEAELAADPKVQVPPVLQVHVLPVHSQSPVHDAFAGGGAPPLLPPHAVAIPNESPRKPTISVRDVTMAQD
jgi:hypothetical protein